MYVVVHVLCYMVHSYVYVYVKKDAIICQSCVLLFDKKTCSGDLYGLPLGLCGSSGYGIAVLSAQHVIQ